MKRTLHVGAAAQVTDQEWVLLPGGELEAPRPRALCAACRSRLQQAAAAGMGRPELRQPLCFACYRAGLDRDRQIGAAGCLNTASEARFQDTLPFEPVNQRRLNVLRAERASARVSAQSGVGRYIDKRRQAQIAARHALQAIAAGLRDRALGRAPHNGGVRTATDGGAAASRFDNQHAIGGGSRQVRATIANVDAESRWWSAVHAAELQLPESWLPFVVSR